ncbi:MAG TPA: hypothetical protein VH639_22280 [Bryobacteraceae bacterium]|jgi:hypothetical protein
MRTFPNRIVVFASLLGAMCAIPIWAQGQIGSVTSSSPFTLRGVTVTPGQGVPSWPVMAGDTIAAGNALTVVTFPDGSVVSMAPGAQARIDSDRGKPVFRLLCGSSTYSLRSIMSVELYASDRAVTPASSLSGPLNVRACSGPAGAAVPAGAAGRAGAAAPAASGGFWTAGHITAVTVIAAGAAAGLGVGIAEATSGGTPVSPSTP